MFHGSEVQGGPVATVVALVAGTLGVLMALLRRMVVAATPGENT